MENILTERDLRLASLNISRGSRALKSHLEFVREGGELYWIVDTDVIHFFLNPRNKARYANVFPSRSDAKQSPGLVALAAILADFVFSDQPHIFHGDQETDGRIFGKKLLLEPHTNELHETLQAMVKNATSAASQAINAVVEKKLQREVVALMAAYLKDTAQNPQQFVSKVQGIISDHLSFILPDGPLAELIRARELLKTRKAAIYEADCPWLHELLNQDAAVQAVDVLADRWRNSIRAEVERMDELRARIFGSKSQQQAGVTRAGDLALREQRDARVLAKLEYLNSLGSKEGEPQRRYVLISGHGLLNGVICNRYRYRRDLPERVFLLKPNVFLGNPHLFPIPDVASEHWIRMTSALVLLDGTKRPDDTNGEQAELPLDSDTDNLELVQRISDEWQELLNFALPFLPAQSRDKRIQEIFKDLLTGKPLDALEQALYLALSELFVVMAELGLSPHHETGPRLPRREPPPLRLAYYPAAEACIQALIAKGESSTQGNKQQNIGSLIESVKQEQTDSKVEDFNYPLLLCLATRFATIGDWHAARVLANHAASIADVTAEMTPLVTGREAAYLECYCRCLEAKNIRELEAAKEALKEYRVALSRETEWWMDPANQASEMERCKVHAFNPQEEFKMHELRARSEELLLDLTHWMHVWFADDREYSTVVQLVKDSSEALNRMLADIETLASDLEMIGVNQESATGVVAMIIRFVQIQIQICAVQCTILLFAVDPQHKEALRTSKFLNPVAMKILDINPTAVTRLIALVARCIWGTIDEHADAFRELDGGDVNNNFTPYDQGRRDFFKKVALIGIQENSPVADFGSIIDPS